MQQSKLRVKRALVDDVKGHRRETIKMAEILTSVSTWDDTTPFKLQVMCNLVNT